MKQGRTIARSLVLSALAGAAGLAGAAETGGLNARILDRDGEPVPEVAVYLEPVAGTDAMTAPAAVVTMNQQDQAFDPHVLVVQTGTRIDFPNGDDVRHHVYSFSPTKRFDFSIAAGSVHDALEFSVPGLVTLGCNIHDDMLGYILVVDTPHFVQSDGQGLAGFANLRPGSYRVGIWTPRVSGSKLPEARIVEVRAGETAGFELRFDSKLYPPHKHSATSLEWSAY